MCVCGGGVEEVCVSRGKVESMCVEALAIKEVLPVMLAKCLYSLQSPH